MKKPCGCCEGTSAATPVSEANRPGLAALLYRAGTHPSFLESMKARLSDTSDPASAALLALTTREANDPAVALLDAWAIVGDVLTFYQERIANEGYLRTAIERRSVVELARLVGYKARPGVSSSVHLAFTLQKDFETTIASGTGAKTTPSQGQLPQTFETSEDIDARAAWNELVPRRTRPQRIDTGNAHDIQQIYFDGTATRLKANDRMLLVFGDLPGLQVLRKVAAVEEDFNNKRTKVSLQLEQFSALAYSIDVQSLLTRQIADCPDLANSPAIQALQAAIQPGAPLVADNGAGLDQAVVAAIKALQIESQIPAQSQQNLNALAALAGTLAASLTTLLNKPEPTVATAVLQKIAAYNAQETHASNVDQSLASLSTKLSGAGKPNLSVKAWLDANELLVNESKPDVDYKTLATAIQALETDWTQPIADLNTMLDGQLVKIVTGLNEAILIPAGPDGPVIARLTALLADMSAAQGKPANVKTAALEKASTELAAALGAATVAALQSKITEVQGFVSNGLSQVQSALAAALAIIGQHPELRIPAADAVLIHNVHAALQVAGTKLPAAALADDPAILETATTAVQNAIGGRVDLLAKRFDEVIAALASAPGNTAQLAIAAVLDASPIPHNLPAGSKEASHAQKLQDIAAGVRGAVSFADAVKAASDATGTIAAEQILIQEDAQAVIKDQDCFKKALSGLARVQDFFLAHFRSNFRRLAADHARQIAGSALFPHASKALEILLAAILQNNIHSLTDLIAALNAALPKIDALKAQATTTAETGWFDAFETDLQNEMFLATRASLEAPPQQVPDLSAFEELGRLATTLSQTIAAPATRQLALADVFREGSDVVARSLIALQPRLDEKLFTGWANQRVVGKPVHVFAFRVRASLFGANAPIPKTSHISKIGPDGQDVTVADDTTKPVASENPNFVDLDNGYDQILNGSWMAVEQSGSQDSLVLFAKAGNPNPAITLAKYGLTGKTTRIQLLDPADPLVALKWYESGTGDFSSIRATIVYAQAEELALAEEPLTCPVGKFDTKAFPSCTFQPDEMQLNGFFEGLKAGRSVVVTGERLDVPGVTVSELRDLAGINQSIDKNLPGDTLHTTLIFTAPLQFGYTRGSVKINANVAHATHGETQKQVLGSGDGTQPFQSFSISHLPLTYLSAPTASGAQSTLRLRVNDVLWHEAGNLAAIGPADRKYIIDIEDGGSTSVQFGDGVHGARLPSGVENVRAVYRNGIGKPGNVPEKQINIMSSPPLGVTAVINPDAATGGADPESRDQARKNVPLAVTALDRLVSVSDFADYARTYTGIAKASSVLLGNLVHVTIAGLDDIPIDAGSDLFQNLQKSFRNFGDPHQPSQLAVREILLIVISAGVEIDPDYEWVIVEAAIRAALLDALGFDRRELGEDVLLSEVIRVIQNTPGVIDVEAGKFGGISLDLAGSDPNQLPQKIVDAISNLPDPPHRLAVNLAHPDGASIRPAQIAYLSPDLPETLLLNQIQPEVSSA